MDNKFQQAENKGRDIVDSSVDGISWNTDTYSTFDGILNDECLIEVKVRSFDKDKYNTYILEDHKVKEFVKSNYKYFTYINVFDKHIVFWSITKRLLKRSKSKYLYLPSTTLGSNNKKRKKKVFFLDINDNKDIIKYA